MIFFGKNRTKLENNLFILYYHLHFGNPGDYDYYNTNKLIDEYCSVYDNFQKINFIERIPALTVYKDIFCEEPIIDIKLSESEYKICEKFLLKQLNLLINNILKIEHYPKRGFIMEQFGGEEIYGCKN